MKKTAFVLCVILVFQIVFTGVVLGADVGGNYISSQGACVLDFETGEVLYEYNGNVSRVPASMTKVMTLYLVYEAMAEGKFDLSTRVPISNKVYGMSCNPEYQCVSPLYPNGYYTVDEILDVVIVYSATGAAVSLAELVAGSEAEFVKKMNEKAAELGIYAQFYDSCGIANNMISPIGMAHLARNLIKNYPEILNKTSQKSVVFKGVTYRTTNHLLDTYFYAGADGLKTGTTSASGYCFTGTASKSGRRVIAVTMASSSSGQRFKDVTTLLDYGFATVSKKFDAVYFTDKSVYINGNEVPAFEYKGAENSLLVVAEDLKNYGFDVVYNYQEKTLDISYNYFKKPAPMKLDYYKNKDGDKAYSIVRPNSITVRVSDGKTQSSMKDVYNVGGYMCISAKELFKLLKAETSKNEKSLYGQISVDDIKVSVQNQTVRFTAGKVKFIDGVLMVPVKETMKAMGKDVSWDQSLNRMKIKDSVMAIKISPDSTTMTKDTYDYKMNKIKTETIKLSSAPVNVNGVIMMPINQVAEAFGAFVSWSGINKTISVVDYCLSKKAS